MRGLVRRSLEIVAEQGFTGDHHFFISFRTVAPGVYIPPHMLDSYPEEMTIVLKTQFKDLTVSEEEFSVGLFFGGVLYYLTIPFVAVTGFADPSADFHLGFRTETADAEDVEEQEKQEERQEQGAEDAPDAPAESAEPASNVVSFAAHKRRK